MLYFKFNEQLKKNYKGYYSFRFANNFFLKISYSIVENPTFL